MHTTQLVHTQLTRTYSSTHNLLHTNPSPSLFPFLLSPCHLYLSFAACWKKLTCGVIQSFNFLCQQAQYFGNAFRRWVAGAVLWRPPSSFSWQAQHFRRVLLRVFCESQCQGSVNPHSTTPDFTLHTWQLRTLHSTLDTLHSTLHTPNSTLYTPQSTLDTPHCTLHTLHFTLHTLHSTLLPTPHSTLHTLHFTPHTLHFRLYTLHFTLYTLHFTLYTPHFTLYTVHPTLYTLHSTLYTPHSTLYTSHLTLYTSHSNPLQPESWWRIRKLDA